MSKKVMFELEWTPDCQGKQDYDGSLVRVSTRYWPRGGGFSVLKDGVFATNADQSIRPSAHSTIYLGETTKLTEREFEGDTEADVKQQVEKWVSAECDRIVAAMLSAYPPKPEQEGGQ